MKHLKKLLGAISFIATAFVLSSCETPVLLNPKGTLGVQEKDLILDALMLMSIVVIPVIIMTLFFAFKYRASNTRAKYRPTWSHSNILEVFVWGIPIIIILVLATITWRTTHSLDPYKPLQSNKEPIEIDVVSLDWKWLFIYPKQNIATVNFVEFPVDTPIAFKLTSDAPMNGFQIDQLGTQIYTMAAMQTQVHLIANYPGDYAGRSTNYSGRGFSGMTFTARATSDKDFETWVNSVKNANEVLDANTYNELAKPSENNPVTVYSAVQPNLFNGIMMKFMMPGMEDLSVSHSKMNM